MGTLIRQTIPNLTNGVSEQAPALRLSTQCEEQLNCRNSLIDGMSKRFNTMEVAEITHTNTNQSFFDTMIRDDKEKYQLIIDGDTVRVWNLDTGYEYTVYVDPAEAARIDSYIKLKDGQAASKVYQTLQIADTTLLLNKSIPAMAKLDTSSEGTAAQLGELYVFSFTSFPWNVDDNNNTWWGGYFGGDSQTEVRYYLPADAQGVINGQPTSTSFVDRYDRTTLPNHTGYFPFIADLIAKKLVELYPNNITDIKFEHDRLWVYTTAGFNLTFTDTSYVDYFDAASWANSIQSGDYTSLWYKIIVGAMIDRGEIEKKDYTDTAYDGVEMTYYDLSYGAVNNPDQALPTVSDAYKARAEAICYVKQADYKVKYKVVLNGTACSYTTPEATTSLARAGLATEVIQSNLVTNINAQTATHGVTATQVNNVIHLTAGTDFTMKIEDSLGGFAFKGFKYVTSEFSELPPSAPDGFPLKVIGSAEEDVEPYHVRFVNDGDTSSGVWEESVAPGIPQEIDAYTMPLRLDRLQDAAYVNATSNPFGIYFKLTAADWGNRTVGDQITAPYPSFISTTDADGIILTPRFITAMSLHKNRLALASSENVVFSQSGDYWNFFRTTVVTLLDSDPIDVSVSTSTVTPIEHIMSNMEEMVLFSREQQLVAKSGEVFAADSLEIAPTSQYQTDLSAEPIALNDAIIFCANRSGSISVQELRPADNGKKVAQELTEHVPTYLRGRARKIVASPSENILFVLPLVTNEETGETLRPNFLYVYQFQDSGGERIQSAWSTWAFFGQVLDVTVDGSVLYLLMRYWDENTLAWKTFIEKMELSHDVVLQHSGGVPVRLDRMVVEGAVTDPDPVYTDGRIVVNEGKKFSGWPVIQAYEYKGFYVRENEQSSVGGKMQVKSMTLRYRNTTEFEVEVHTEGRTDPLTKDFDGRVLGNLNNLIGQTPVVEGEFRFPVMSRGDRASVLITNQHYTDANFLSASVESFYNDRARKM